MDPVPAPRALGYALSRDVLGVYLVVLTGLALLVVVPDLLPAGNVIVLLLRDVLRLVGFVLFYVGLVALLFKIVADATGEGR